VEYSYSAPTQNYVLNPAPDKVASDNPDRVGLIIQVKGGGVASIKFGASIMTDINGITDGIEISGELSILEFCPTSSIFMRAEIASTIITLCEITKHERWFK